ncbi:unnamed protein product, partial [Chrysoparadoxa australica]
MGRGAGFALVALLVLLVATRISCEGPDLSLVPEGINIVYNQICMYESAVGLKDALARQGIASVVVNMNPVNELAGMETRSVWLPDTSFASARPQSLFFIFGGHEGYWDHLPQNYVAMQLEQ